MAILKPLSIMERILIIIFFVYLVAFDWMNSGIFGILAGVYAIVAMIALIVKGIYLTRKEKNGKTNL